MVKIIGYYIVFFGNPDTRHKPIRVSVELGLQALKRWNDKEHMLFIKGEGYAFKGIQSIEKIRGAGLDLQRAISSGQTVVDEDDLPAMYAKLTGQEELPQLPPASQQQLP